MNLPAFHQTHPILVWVWVPKSPLCFSHLSSLPSKMLPAEKPLTFGTRTTVNRQERKPGTSFVNVIFHFLETHRDLIPLLVFVLQVSNLWGEGASELESAWGKCDRLGGLSHFRTLTVVFGWDVPGEEAVSHAMNYQKAGDVRWWCVSCLSGGNRIALANSEAISANRLQTRLIDYN